MNWEDLVGKTITSALNDSEGWRSDEIATTLDLHFADGSSIRVEGQCCCSDHAGLKLLPIPVQEK